MKEASGKNICEVMMGLKLRLEWYDKQTQLCQGEESSKDLGDDESVLNALGIPVENNINNGGFNVIEKWVATIQPFFQHDIALTTYDYQIAFDYSEAW
ncbi:colicin E3-like toxin immunity protein [Pseudomonas lini]